MARTREELRPYQRAGVRFIKEKKRCALFVDPGLGKTSTTLTALGDLIDDLDCGRVLITAPPQVAKKTWHEEMAQWAHLRGKSYVIIRGTPATRRKLLQRPACYHVISMELLPWLLTELGGKIPTPEKVDDFGEVTQKRDPSWRPPPKCPYDAIVVDESSKVKESNTNRWRALKQLAFMVDYFVELTGTPAANGYENLWAQIYLLDGGQRLGGNITAYRDRWFSPKFDGSGYKVKDWAVKIIEERISDIVFTLRGDDYSTLPPIMNKHVRLELDEPTMKEYKKFERTYVLKLSEERKLIARDGAAITTKLLQLANGIVYDADKNEHTFHRVKLDALIDLVDEYQGQPLLVAYAFRSDVARIMKVFPAARLFDDKQETQDAWNRGEIPMLLIHPKAGAHGLNLQFGGNNVVWYGPTYSLEDHIQLAKRLHRSGQKKPVMVHHFIAEGTIDEDVMAALEGKDDMQEALLNALKKRVELYVQQS